MSYQVDILGKYEDAGQLVKGGRIDQHWNQEGIYVDKKYFTGSRFQKEAYWLYDTEKALEHFGLRSIEYGNWMSQQDRANFLYGSMLSLHHLAALFDVKDKEIGLGGKLSIALGARGKGFAAGHYEPNPYAVINITKTQGIGVLAHEYAHAVDNIVSYYTKTAQKYVSGGRTTRIGYNEYYVKKGNWFEQQFEEFFNTLYFQPDGERTDFCKSISLKDEYWKRRTEVFARTFEVYIKNRLSESDITNHFLVSGASGDAYPPLDLVDDVSRTIENIVHRAFKVMKNSHQLNGISIGVEGYKGFRTTIKQSARLEDTLTNMKRIAKRDVSQVTELAKMLQGDTVQQSTKNIWNYLRANTRYKLDTHGIEELRTPARSLVDGKKGLTDKNYGIDCDDYTILISALLLSMGIPHEYRITAYENKGQFQHIYPVAFDSTGREYVIDCVPEIPHFNYEAKPIIDLKTVSMELQELSGVPDTKSDLIEELNQPFSLSGFDDDDDDFLESTFLAGLGEVDSEDEADIVLSGAEDVEELIERGLLAEVNKGINSLLEEKNQRTTLSELVDVDAELDIFYDIMEAWSDPEERIEVLEEAIESGSSYTNFFKSILASLDSLEEQSSQLNGLEDEPIFLAKTSMGGYDLSDLLDDSIDRLGRRKKRKKGRLKNLFKKIGKGLKKAVKAVVKHNPATIAMRAASLLVLKTNLFKLGSRLIYGYLTEGQAKAQGLDLDEWRKLVEAKNKAERFYTKMGGKASKFKNAIIKGKAAKKTGVQIAGLGVATTATATAAASGFITFAKNLLSKINPKKLFAKIKDKVKGDNADSSNPEDFSDPEDFDTENNNVPTPTNENTSRTTQTDMNPENVPSVPVDGGFKEKIIAFYKTHKKKIVVVGIGGVVGIVAIVAWNKIKKKKKRSLAGVKAAKTRARNRRQSTKKSYTTRSRRATSKSLKGSTTIIRVPSKSVKKTRISKRSNSNRLKAMHAKAKQLQKKNPRTKYSTLLKKASKMI